MLRILRTDRPQHQAATAGKIQFVTNITVLYDFVSTSMFLWTLHKAVLSAGTTDTYTETWRRLCIYIYIYICTSRDTAWRRRYFEITSHLREKERERERERVTINMSVVK
jgi:hypothetical protein